MSRPKSKVKIPVLKKQISQPKSKVKIPVLKKQISRPKSKVKIPVQKGGLAFRNKKGLVTSEYHVHTDQAARRRLLTKLITSGQRSALAVQRALVARRTLIKNSISHKDFETMTSDIEFVKKKFYDSALWNPKVKKAVVYGLVESKRNRRNSDDDEDEDRNDESDNEMESDEDDEDTGNYDNDGDGDQEDANENEEDEEDDDDDQEESNENEEDEDEEEERPTRGRRR